MDNRPSATRQRSSAFLLLLAGLFAGVFLERQGLFPGSPPPTPVAARAAIAPFWEAWRYVEHFYVDRAAVQPQKMTAGAIRGMLNSLGDIGHTSYLTADEYKEMQSSLQGQLEGIGARMTLRNNQPTIVETIPGSPARAAGLRPGDILLDVNGQPVASMPLDRIILMVRGPAWTPVRLRVLHQGTRSQREQPVVAASVLGLACAAGGPLLAAAALVPAGSGIQELDITRAKVEVEVIAWCLVPGQPVAHIALREFGVNAAAELGKAIESARKQGARGLIVDVRGNPGGLKQQAVAVTSEFLNSGDVFIEQDADGHRKVVPVEPGGTATQIPLVVLIDEGSASSSEIFAGALQDHQRATLVGTHTFGTGTVLVPLTLSDGSAMLLAVEEWLTPKGRVIWHKGIKPDIEVKLPEGARVLIPEDEARLNATELSESEDQQFLTALATLRKQLNK
jgi:carboxyl-terminal processing protease